jgi:anti-sigma regulatory factor (Ser/Thr protein kinase)
MGFSADTARLAEVRRFARAAAASFAPTADLAMFEVVVGELAANAVVHQAGTAEIIVSQIHDGCIEVSVTDRGAGLPQLVDGPPWSTEGHRGMQLVTALAESWGTEPVEGGKRVWAKVAVAPVAGHTRVSKDGRIRR